MKRRLGAWLARLGGAVRRMWRQWFAPAESERLGLPDPAWREDDGAAAAPEPAEAGSEVETADPGAGTTVSDVAAAAFAGEEIRSEVAETVSPVVESVSESAATVSPVAAAVFMGAATDSPVAASVSESAASESAGADIVSAGAEPISAGATTVFAAPDLVSPVAEAVLPDAETVSPVVDVASVVVEAALAVAEPASQSDDIETAPGPVEAPKRADEIPAAPASEVPASDHEPDTFTETPSEPEVAPVAVSPEAPASPEPEPEPAAQAAPASEDGSEVPLEPEAAAEATAEVESGTLAAADTAVEAEGAPRETPVQPEETAAPEETTPFAADVAAQPEAAGEVAPAPETNAEVASAPDTRVEATPGPENAGEAASAPETPAAAEAAAGSAIAASPAPADGAPAAPPRPKPVVEIPKDYVPAAESEHELYRIELETFEGPLDLLLFLIRRHTLDIFDIPVAFICERYLDYLKMMEELNIDVAAEFLAMAAELLHIKSKMLLPKPVEVEDDDEADPRAELVRRLLEYQKYKDAAERLASLTRTGRDVFGRTPEPLPPPEGLAPLAEVSLFALVEAFDALLARQKPELRHHVLLEAASVRQRIRALIEVFAERRQVRFVELLGDLSHRLDVVVSFLAILEMARLRLLRVYQSLEGEIHLEGRFETVEQALERLEGIDKSLDGLLDEAAAAQEKGAPEKGVRE